MFVHDDVGAASLVLHCTTLDTKSHHVIHSDYAASLGGLLKLSEVHSCPPDYYLVSFNQKVGTPHCYSISSGFNEIIFHLKLNQS